MELLSSSLLRCQLKKYSTDSQETTELLDFFIIKIKPVNHLKSMKSEFMLRPNVHNITNTESKVVQELILYLSVTTYWESCREILQKYSSVFLRNEEHLDEEVTKFTIDVLLQIYCTW